MDQIDINLSDAWHRVRATLATDPAEARRRWRRTLSPTLTRPPRAWCLAIRASDTRISTVNAEIALDDNVRLGLDAALARGAASGGHTLALDGATIRALCKPVEIPWPGLPRFRIAPLLGIHTSRVNNYIDSGALCISRHDNAGSHGKPGRPIPILYTPSPIDPNAFDCRPPDAIWGTLWQWMWECLPEDYGLRVRRVPRLIPYRGELKQRGWEFICPGLPGIQSRVRGADRKGQFGDDFRARGCGRRCRRLYGPMPVWTIGRAEGNEQGLALSPLPLGEGEGEGIRDEEEGEGKTTLTPTLSQRERGRPALALSGEWFPGQSDLLAGRRRFACLRCWKPHYMSCEPRMAWNRFVTYLSGGLLYGREVPMPPELAGEPVKRKRAYVACPTRGPRRISRERVLEGLLSGLTYARIAAREGCSLPGVGYNVQLIYKEYGVHSRGELKEKIERRVGEGQRSA